LVEAEVNFRAWNLNGGSQTIPSGNRPSERAASLRTNLHDGFLLKCAFIPVDNPLHGSILFLASIVG
jgi:hypothetical protein